jgi:hypothetical protein
MGRRTFMSGICGFLGIASQSCWLAGVLAWNRWWWWLQSIAEIFGLPPGILTCDPHIRALTERYLNGSQRILDN